MTGLHSSLCSSRARRPGSAAPSARRRRFLSLLLLCFMALGPLSVSLPHAIWDQQVDSLHEHQAAHLPEQRELRPAAGGESREFDLDPPGPATIVDSLLLLSAEGARAPPPYPPSVRWTVTLAAANAPRAPPRLG